MHKLVIAKKVHGEKSIVPARPWIHSFSTSFHPCLEGTERVSRWMDGLLFRRLVSQALTDFVLQITRSLESACRLWSVADRGKRGLLLYKSRTRYKSSPVSKMLTPTIVTDNQPRRSLFPDNDFALNFSTLMGFFFFIDIHIYIWISNDTLRRENLNNLLLSIDLYGVNIGQCREL